MKELIETKPVRQIDLLKRKLDLLRKAGITGRIAYKAALEMAAAHYKSNPSNLSLPTQLSWHFQIDLNGQQYLFKEE